MEDRIDAAFNMEKAVALARTVLLRIAAADGGKEGETGITISEKQTFAMIRGYERTGLNIRLKMGITPGLIPEWQVRSSP